VKKKRIRRVSISKLTNISFLPSVFTTFNLFLGYLAVVQILKANYITATYMVTFGVIMDALDGTIARLTKTESGFGMQLDSLVDGVTFGLAPGIMIYQWGYQGLGLQYGQIIGFIFLSAGVIRLARFNVYHEAKAFPSNIFVGLPIPLAALAVLSAVLVVEMPLQYESQAIWFAVYVVIIAFLMVSNIKYRTLKKIKSRYNLWALFLLASVIALSFKYPSYTIPTLTLLYVVSPIFFFISGRLKKIRKKSNIEKED
jgi:CDP-diacylglycerol--serine O-phosphatidyltransferase